MKEQATVRLESIDGSPIRADLVARALESVGVRCRTVPMPGRRKSPPIRAGENTATVFVFPTSGNAA